MEVLDLAGLFSHKTPVSHPTDLLLPWKLVRLDIWNRECADEFDLHEALPLFKTEAAGEKEKVQSWNQRA